MKALKFSSSLIKQMQDNTRNVTWRLNDDKDISVGDIVEVLSAENYEKKGYMIVESVAIKKYKDISDQDLIFYSGYDSMESFHDSMRKYYKDSDLENGVVKIITFVFSPTPVKERPVKHYDTIIIYSDGGSRGNPGPSASGYVLLDENKEIIYEGGEYLGITTNNQAEYHSLLSAIKEAKKHGARNIRSFMDSMLVVNQINGIYKVKNKDLWPIYKSILDEIKTCQSFTIQHVPRKLNSLADAQVNTILDSVKNTEN